MASPVLSQRTYRLTRIPGKALYEDIRQLFPSDIRDVIQHISLARTHHNLTACQVSTVTFETEPAILSSLPNKHGSLLEAYFPHVGKEYSDVWIDAHFHGFTRLNTPTNEHEAVDVIALTGLGGKPFASWQCHDGSMWLRDHLPLKLPNARIAIYGCFSDVGIGDSTSTMSDLAEMFFLDLMAYRESDIFNKDNKRRPLILMGHSSGGLIIKDTWCLSNERVGTMHKSLHSDLCGLVFFGTPHNGMSWASILPGLAGHPTETLIRDLEPGSTYIKYLKARFSPAIRSLRLISCYELRQTPQAEFQPDGSLIRCGEGAMNAAESTACLYWPNEIRIPINENHSMIAKLDNRNGSAYYRVAESLCELIRYSIHPYRSAYPESMCLSPQHQQDLNFQPSSTISTKNELQMSGGDVFERTADPEDTPYSIARRPGELGHQSKPAGSMALNPQVRIYVHGVWDLFHYGHVRFLRFAKEAKSNTYLIVGVIEDDISLESTRDIVMSCAERSEVVRACRYVDEVIDHCPAILPSDFLAQHRIDLVGCNETESTMATLDPFRLVEAQDKIFVVPRVPKLGWGDILKMIAKREHRSGEDKQSSKLD